MDTEKTGIMNVSKGGLDSENTLTHLPQTGYDGQVVISPYVQWQHNGFTVFRSEIISHELAENYARTVKNWNYNGDPQGESKWAIKGAHAYANFRMSNTHTVYSVIRHKLTREEYNEYINNK